jgi:hypothetical protein
MYSSWLLNLLVHQFKLCVVEIPWRKKSVNCFGMWRNNSNTTSLEYYVLPQSLFVAPYYCITMKYNGINTKHYAWASVVIIAQHAYHIRVSSLYVHVDLGLHFSYFCRIERSSVNVCRLEVKVEFTLKQTAKAWRGSRGIALLFLYLRR